MNVSGLLNKVNKFFSVKDDEYVCLDLGTRYIKGIYVQDNVAKKSFAAEVKEKDDCIGTALQLLREHELWNKNVRIALKGSDTIVRYINFPKVDNLKESLSFELSKYVPFSSDAVYFDAFSLQEPHAKKESLVLLVAARKELIDSVLQRFEQERVKISEITVDSVALINLFLLKPQEQKCYAALDFGYASSLITLMKQQLPVLSREVKVSGGMILESLSQERNISLEEAEKYLVESASEKELLEFSDEYFSDLTSELKNSFDYFEMNMGERIQHIYLTGGFSVPPAVGASLAKMMGVEVKLYDFDEQWARDVFSDSHFNPLMFSVAAGLIG